MLSGDVACSKLTSVYAVERREGHAVNICLDLPGCFEVQLLRRWFSTSRAHSWGLGIVATARLRTFNEHRQSNGELESPHVRSHRALQQRRPPVAVNVESAVDSVMMNQHARYLGQRLFTSNVIDQIHRHTHTRLTALPGPLKWSATIINESWQKDHCVERNVT